VPLHPTWARLFQCLTHIGPTNSREIEFSHGLCNKRTPAVRHPRAANDTNLPTCLVGIGAYGGALYWARRLVELGHRVKSTAPQYVKPF
jgi:transposase